MKYIFLLLCLCALHLFAHGIEVTIIYDNGKPDKVVTTTYSEGIAALELLKEVANVVTYKKGNFTFVKSIDGMESIPGKFGWFYLIDGESVHKMAESYRLKEAKNMTWVYKVEACY